MRLRRWSVARQLLLLQSALLAVVLLVAAAAAVQINRDRQQSAARDKVRSLAESIAANPFVVEQASTATPWVRLEPYAERIRHETGVDFVVIMAPDRTRWSHPNRDLIGQPFIGRIEPALHGRVFTETNTGTLGASVRAVAPVLGPGGQIVALVSDGITTEALHEQLVRQVPFVIVALAVLLLVALLGAGLVSRRLGRQTRGADARTLMQLFASHEAVLHSIREGLLVTDNSGRISVANDEARRLLGLTSDVTAKPSAEIPVAESLRELLASGRAADDELHLTDERVLVVNQLPVAWRGRKYGTVTSFRDRTELEALTGELDSTKAFAESLRSQAHETANRLHTMIVLIETGRSDEAVRYATSQLELSQQLTDRIMTAVDEPVVAALLLGKTAQAAERNVELTLDVDGSLGGSGIPGSDLVTIVGNLVDNAIDASAESVGGRIVVMTMRAADGQLLIQVDDTGPGLADDLVESAFARGWSTKGHAVHGPRGLGLALVRQTALRHGGCVVVSRAAGGGASFCVRLPLPQPAAR
jgi:two-component system, CitB family, sensor kinase